MSSDNFIFLNSDITLIHLRESFLYAPLISHELLTVLERAKEKGEKIALLYNRRGSGRAWICQDCGYFPPCPHCDIALAYHTSPQRNLICHLCNYIDTIPSVCPQCQGTRFSAVGIGIQKIEEDIRKLIPSTRLLRIDSDTHEKKSKLFQMIEQSDILLGTYNSLGILEKVDTIVFLLFESDLTIPDYRMEEVLFHAIDYAKKLGINILIQTHMRDHPLLSIIMEGNYKDFLTYMSRERELFQYPPYTEFITLRIHDHSQDRVRDIITKLANKIILVKKDSTFFSYDRDIWERSAGEWSQKIIMKDPDLSSVIQEIQGEVLRNRGVTLEWK